MTVAPSLTPLLNAGGGIPWHAFAALAAFALGLVQFAAPKGTVSHRMIGWLWVGLMALVAVSSVGISTICQFGRFSVINLLSVFVLAMLPLGILRARRHRLRAHAPTMTALFFKARVIAGGFTQLPGRILHAVVFGDRRLRPGLSPAAGSGQAG